MATIRKKARVASAAQNLMNQLQLQAIGSEHTQKIYFNPWSIRISKRISVELPSHPFSVKQRTYTFQIDILKVLVKGQFEE